MACGRSYPVPRTLPFLRLIQVQAQNRTQKEIPQYQNTPFFGFSATFSIVNVCITRWYKKRTTRTMKKKVAKNN